jgi:hypothetical protein
MKPKRSNHADEPGEWRDVDAVLDAPDDIGKRLEELLGVMKELTRE